MLPGRLATASLFRGWKMATRESFDKSGNPSYLQPNRKADQEDRVKKDPVVSGKVKKKDKPVHKKLSEAVLAEDVKDVKTYLVWDVLIPALKDTVSDLVKRGIDAMLYGNGKSPTIERHGNASYRKYQAASERRNTRSKTSCWKTAGTQRPSWNT